MTTLALDELSTTARRELGLEDAPDTCRVNTPVRAIRRPVPATAVLSLDGRWRRKPLPPRRTATIEPVAAPPG